MIRMMRQSDIPAALALAAVCWDPETARVGQPDFEAAFCSAPWRPTFYVFIENGSVVGMAGWANSWLNFGVYSLHWVAVHPRWRGLGYARRLIEQCLFDLRLFARAVILVTSSADGLYQKLGFNIVGVVPGDPEDRLMMWTLPKS